MLKAGAEFLGCVINDKSGTERIDFRYMAVWKLPDKALPAGSIRGRKTDAFRCPGSRICRRSKSLRDNQPEKVPCFKQERPVFVSPTNPTCESSIEVGDPDYAVTARWARAGLANQ